VATYPLILEVKGNSLDDGPGIRTVVFFKGCPLSCSWCHNPESRKRTAELSFDPAECVSCDRCLEVCGEGALDREATSFVDRRKCTLCFECSDACPSGALSRVGREMSVGEVLSEIGKDVPFFRTSGGGVTLSGGEPTLYMDYCAELLQGLARLGVGTILETCGLFDLSEFERLMASRLEHIYFDLKLADPEEHRRYCGTGNERIVESFRRLMRLGREGGTPVLPRIPLVPGITDTDRNLSGLSVLLAEAGAVEVALMPYNPLWLEKSVKLGGADPFAGRESMTRWMDRSEIERCRSHFPDLTIF